MAPRLKERYDAQVREALRQELGLSNVMEVPRLTKIVINMGVGRATQQGSLLDGAVTDLTLISGQKPLVTKATKSIAEAETAERKAVPRPSSRLEEAGAEFGGGDAALLAPAEPAVAVAGRGQTSRPGSGPSRRESRCLSAFSRRS